VYAKWPLISIILFILAGFAPVTGVVSYVLGLRRKKDRSLNRLSGSGMIGIWVALLLAFIAFGLSFQHGLMLAKLDEIHDLIEEIRNLLR
jgi:uncharacterized membrane protein